MQTLQCFNNCVFTIYNSYLSSEGRNYNILSLQEHSGKSDLIEANSASLKRDNSMATIRLTRERYNNSVLHEREKDGDRETRRLNRSRLGREFEQKYESNFNFINHSTTNNVISAEEPKCSNFVPRLSLPITKS